jgi:hypothetical protein
MVADSYTHVGLNGPGILVTNNGYAQCTSSYAFFNKYHIKALNGGQANLAASTTDFGEKALVADGKSTAAIFTATVNGAAADGDLTFDIDGVTAGTGWFGDDTKPASNMLVTVNSVTYPILSSTVITGGHRVTVSRPDPNNRSTNLGLNGAVDDDASVEFFLRSQIASSGHTMEYVGSGMDYDALPENGGVPDESAQITELNDGKVWTAITDHNGKFKIGGNQTDDPFFEVDQQLGLVTIPEGSIAFNLLSDLTPQLGGDLDVNGQEIVTDAGNENIVLNPHGTGAVNVSSSKIINVTDPTDDQDAATKKYVDDTVAGIDEVVEDTTPQLGGDLDVNGNEITSASNGDVTINPNGTGDIVLDANVGIGTSSPLATCHIASGSDDNSILFVTGADTSSEFVALGVGANHGMLTAGGSGSTSTDLILRTTNSGTEAERMRIDSSGRLLVGHSSSRTTANALEPHFQIEGINVSTSTAAIVRNENGANGPILALSKSRGTSTGSNTVVQSGDITGAIHFAGADGTDLNSFTAWIQSEVDGTPGSNDMPGRLTFYTTADGANSPTERMRIDSSGNVGIGASPSHVLDVTTTGDRARFKANTGNCDIELSSIAGRDYLISSKTDGSLTFFDEDASAERMRIDSSGNVGIGTSSPSVLLHVNESTGAHANLILENSEGSAKLGTNSNIFYVESSQHIFYNSGGSTEYARINSSGNVGIGTSSPGFKLHCVEDGSFAGICASSNVTADALASRFALGNSVGTARFTVNMKGGSNELAYLGSEGNFPFYFQINGSEKMRLDADGRLLVGKSSADLSNSKLEVTGGSNTNFISILNESASDLDGNRYSKLFFRGTQSGGETSTLCSVQSGHDGSSDDQKGRITFHTNDGSDDDTPTERMRIDSNGQALFFSSGNPITSGCSAGAGTTTEVFTGVHSRSSTSSGGTVSIHIFSNGNIENTNNSYGQISDVKLKENIVDANSQWNDIKGVQVRNFNFKEETGNPTHTQIGVVAQELETVSPGLVYETPDRDEEGNDLGTVTKGVNYSVLYMKAVKALQEAMDRIETLETKVAALEAE